MRQLSEDIKMKCLEVRSCSVAGCRSSPQLESLFVFVVILGMLEADMKHSQFDLGTVEALLAETSSMTSPVLLL